MQLQEFAHPSGGSETTNLIQLIAAFLFLVLVPMFIVASGVVSLAVAFHTIAIVASSSHLCHLARLQIENQSLDPIFLDLDDITRHTVFGIDLGLKDPRSWKLFVRGFKSLGKRQFGVGNRGAFLGVLRHVVISVDRWD